MNSFTLMTTKPIKPRLFFKLKLEASRSRFILYFLGHQKQSILKRFFLHIIFYCQYQYNVEYKIE
jgi:hypothetical protein